MTTPSFGFSFAVSGSTMPPFVFSSASTLFTTILSLSGRMFSFAIVDSFWTLVSTRLRPGSHPAEPVPHSIPISVDTPPRDRELAHHGPHADDVERLPHEHPSPHELHLVLELLRLLSGDEDPLRPRELDHGLAEGLDPVEIRHVEVEDREVQGHLLPLEGAGTLDGLEPPCREEEVVPVRRQNAREALETPLVVIDEEDVKLAMFIIPPRGRLESSHVNPMTTVTPASSHVAEVRTICLSLASLRGSRSRETAGPGGTSPANPREQRVCPSREALQRAMIQGLAQT